MDLQETSTKILLLSVVGLVGLFIAGAVWWGAKATGTVTTPVDVANVQLEGVPFIGSASAPVTLIEWSDYQCPACKMFEEGALTQVVREYVQAGKVKVVFKDLAFLGQDSLTAGAYGRAVWKLYPGQYFDWRTAMFKAQDAEGDKGFGDAVSIDKLTAAIVGIDAVKVATEVATNKAAYDALLKAEKSEAQSLKISSTPSFVVGKEFIAGAYPFNTFKKAIDLLLP